MEALNSVLRGLFDALLSPFRDLHPYVGLTLLAAVISVALLLVYKVTSNQTRLSEVKSQIHAGLFEIRLFNDDLRAILRAQLDILRHNLNYLRLSLVPLAWVIVPLLLVFAQLQFHYGYRGLAPGERALVKVELVEGEASASRPQAELEAPPGVEVETEALWVPSQRELTWRIAARQEGDYELGVTLDGERYAKSLVVSERVVRRSPVRVARGFVDQLLYPAEPPLPEGAPVQAISVTYPGSMEFFGSQTEWWWMIGFFALTVVFALALRNRLGVTI